MKARSSLAVAIVLAVSSLSAAVYASPVTEPNSTFNFVPPQCSSPAVKAAHPDWFRDGGYCNPFDPDGH
jgi:hypothetical protein